MLNNNPLYSSLVISEAANSPLVYILVCINYVFPEDNFVENVMTQRKAI